MNESLTMEEILRLAREAADEFRRLSPDTQTSLRNDTDWSGAQLSGYEFREVNASAAVC